MSSIKGRVGPVGLLVSAIILMAVGFVWLTPDREPIRVVSDPLKLVPGTAPAKPITMPPPSPSPSPTPIVVSGIDAYRASLAAVSQEVAPLIAVSADKKRYHDMLRGEGRDEAWATRSEAMLRAEFARLPGMDRGSRPIAINCGTTLCEVSGDNDDPRDGLNGNRMKSLQDPELDAMLSRRGYDNKGVMFGPGRTGEAFLGYYQREAPADGQAPPPLPPGPG